MSGQKNQNKKIGADWPAVGAADAGTGDYKVGRGRPPKEYQWKKGQSGNPSGRPRKKPGSKAFLAKIMNERITIREDGRPHKVTKGEALFRSQMAKAINGDVRSARLIMDEAARVGLGSEQEGGISALLPPKIQSVQSDALFAKLEPDLLTNEEKIELARLGKIIDFGGDFTALSPADFARIKQITDKGRGKDVTPRG